MRTSCSKTPQKQRIIPGWKNKTICTLFGTVDICHIRSFRKYNDIKLVAYYTHIKSTFIISIFKFLLSYPRSTAYIIINK